jgi:hypothetical protein
MAGTGGRGSLLPADCSCRLPTGYLPADCLLVRQIYEELKIINYASGQERVRLLAIVVLLAVKEVRRALRLAARRCPEDDEFRKTGYQGSGIVRDHSNSTNVTARACSRGCAYRHFSSSNKGQHIVACCRYLEFLHRPSTKPVDGFLAFRASTFTQKLKVDAETFNVRCKREFALSVELMA